MDEIFMEFFFDDGNLNEIIHLVVENIVDPPNIFENVERREPVRNENYFEITVDNYNLNEFKSHFRMSRPAMESLFTVLAPNLPTRNLIHIEKQILFSVWMLSTPESYRSVADRFGISCGTGHYVFMNVITAVCSLKDAFIYWPSARLCTETASRIERQCGIPGIVGAIDGTHIQIKQPTNNAVDYFNRKDVHSVILQGVCNDELIFLDVFIGMPGRAHDARVFRNSPMFQHLIGNVRLLPPQQHLLGDAAYPLLQNLLKPYRDNGHLNPTQVRFNEVMSGRRAMIERAFGLLKGKWRRLKYLDMSLPHTIPDVILSACILHNFVLRHDGNVDIDFEENVVDQHDNNVAVVIEDNADQNAEIKRDFIASLL